MPPPVIGVVRPPSRANSPSPAGNQQNNAQASAQLPRPPPTGISPSPPRGPPPVQMGNRGESPPTTPRKTVVPPPPPPNADGQLVAPIRRPPPPGPPMNAGDGTRNSTPIRSVAPPPPPQSSATQQPTSVSPTRRPSPPPTGPRQFTNSPPRSMPPPVGVRGQSTTPPQTRPLQAPQSAPSQSTPSPPRVPAFAPPNRPPPTTSLSSPSSHPAPPTRAPNTPRSIASIISSTPPAVPTRRANSPAPAVAPATVTPVQYASLNRTPPPQQSPQPLQQLQHQPLSPEEYTEAPPRQQESIAIPNPIAMTEESSSAPSTQPLLSSPQQSSRQQAVKQSPLPQQQSTPPPQQELYQQQQQPSDQHAARGAPFQAPQASYSPTPQRQQSQQRYPLAMVSGGHLREAIPETIESIANKSGVPLETVLRLNPHLRRYDPMVDALPVGTTVHIPASADLLQNLPTATELLANHRSTSATTVDPGGQQHTMRSQMGQTDEDGESLLDVAKNTETDIAALLHCNPHLVGYPLDKALPVGTKLSLPEGDDENDYNEGGREVAAADRLRGNSSSTEPDDLQSTQPQPTPTVTTVTPMHNATNKSAEEDIDDLTTLYRIARRFGEVLTDLITNNADLAVRFRPMGELPKGTRVSVPAAQDGLERRTFVVGVGLEGSGPSRGEAASPSSLAEIAAYRRAASSQIVRGWGTVQSHMEIARSVPKSPPKFEEANLWNVSDRVPLPLTVCQQLLNHNPNSRGPGLSLEQIAATLDGATVFLLRTLNPSLPGGYPGDKPLPFGFEIVLPDSRSQSRTDRGHGADSDYEAEARMYREQERSQGGRDNENTTERSGTAADDGLDRVRSLEGETLADVAKRFNRDPLDVFCVNPRLIDDEIELFEEVLPTRTVVCLPRNPAAGSSQKSPNRTILPSAAAKFRAASVGADGEGLSPVPTSGPRGDDYNDVPISEPTPSPPRDMRPTKTILANGRDTLRDVCNEHFLTEDVLRGMNPFMLRYYTYTIIPRNTLIILETEELRAQKARQLLQHQRANSPPLTSGELLDGRRVFIVRSPTRGRPAASTNSPPRTILANGRYQTPPGREDLTSHFHPRGNSAIRSDQTELPINTLGAIASHTNVSEKILRRRNPSLAALASTDPLPKNTIVELEGDPYLMPNNIANDEEVSYNRNGGNGFSLYGGRSLDRRQVVRVMGHKAAVIVGQRYFNKWRLFANMFNSKKLENELDIENERERMRLQLQAGQIKEEDLRRRVTELRIALDSSRPSSRPAIASATSYNGLANANLATFNNIATLVHTQEPGRRSTSPYGQQLTYSESRPNDAAVMMTPQVAATGRLNSNSPFRRGGSQTNSGPHNNWAGTTTSGVIGSSPAVVYGQRLVQQLASAPPVLETRYPTDRTREIGGTESPNRRQSPLRDQQNAANASTKVSPLRRLMSVTSPPQHQYQTNTTAVYRADTIDTPQQRHQVEGLINSPAQSSIGSRRSLGLLLNGLHVTRCIGAAAAAGIQPNDTIIRLAGQLVSSGATLKALLDREPGPRVSLTLQTPTGHVFTTMLPLVSAAGNSPTRTTSPLPIRHNTIHPTSASTLPYRSMAGPGLGHKSPSAANPVLSSPLRRTGSSIDPTAVGRSGILSSPYRRVVHTPKGAYNPRI